MIKVENATTEALRAQVAKCPFVALSLKNTVAPNPNNIASGTKIEVTKSGPLIIRGTLDIKKLTGALKRKVEPPLFVDVLLRITNPIAMVAILK